MVKKFKIYSIGNDGSFNYYVFDKRQLMVEELSKMLREVFGLKLDMYDESFDKNYKLVHKKRHFEKYKDYHESLRATRNNSRADIFYGSKKVFLTVICSASSRKKFNEDLFKFCSMPEPKERK